MNQIISRIIKRIVAQERMLLWVGIGLLIATTLVTRLYRLGEIPMILNPDEASIAYNAFLLKETGMDEWGVRWPIILQAFGDQKPIVYPLLVVISFILTGISDAAVRLPAAIAGLCIVYGAYRLARVLGYRHSDGLLAAWFVALMPVFVFYSRVGYEAVVAMALMLGGVVLLYAKTTRRMRSDLVSILLSAVAMLTYSSPLIIFPFFILPLPLMRGLRVYRKWMPTVVLALVTWVGLFGLLQQFNTQKSQITIFSQSFVQAEYIPYRLAFPAALQPIFGNQAVFSLLQIAKNSLHALHPSFLLFNQGGHPWHAIPGSGYLTLSLYILGMIGVIVAMGRIVYNCSHLLIRLKTHASLRAYPLQWSDALLLWMMSVSLLPASITTNAPHATRSLFFFVVFAIFAVKGWKFTLYLGEKLFSSIPAIPILLSVLIIGVVGIQSGWYLYQYFGQYAQSTAQQAVFQPGYAQVLTDVEAQYPDARIAVIDGRGFQYVLTAWYLRLQPNVFFATIHKQQPDVIQFRYGERVDRYRFIKEPEDRIDERVLLYWDENTWQKEVSK